MRKIFFILIIFIIIVVYFLFTTHKNVNTDAHYVGEGQCVSCHSIQTHSLDDTLHPKIFQPVKSLKQILGDFNTSNEVVDFKKEDVEFVVGSKWEQVYMRLIDGEYYVFPAKWLVTTQQWVPYKVHDWIKNPASAKCNGCHTTGYDHSTYEFNEYGVHCEACHGPASTHVEHQKMQTNTECVICHTEHKEYQDDIIVSQKSAVCGQCHTRGTTSITTSDGKTTLFNFPLEYIPGQELNSSFVQSTIQNDTKKKNWWGQGLSKNRHQEYADFSFSKHANSLTNLKTKKNPHGGNKDQSCLACHSEDYRSAKEGKKPTIESAKLGITCVTCHEPHGIDTKIRSKRSVDARCAECHIFGEKTDKQHYPCPTSKASCVGCHMPLIGKTGGEYTIRSHAFKIVPPEATQKYGMPSSCQNGSCHQEQTLEWAIGEYEKFYKKKQKPKTLVDFVKEKR